MRYASVLQVYRLPSQPITPRCVLQAGAAHQGAQGGVQGHLCLVRGVAGLRGSAEDTLAPRDDTPRHGRVLMDHDVMGV